MQAASARFTAAVLFLLALTSGSTSRAEEGVRFEAEIDGEQVALPLLRTDVEARIQGDLATVRMTQHFVNPSSIAIHARYVFPLPPDAAVHAMRMVNGDRMIEGEIHRKKEARAIFDAARERGNQAALLGQSRSNIFTQEVANLLPGMPIRVVLEYVHVAPKRDGQYELHVPLVVGPRYLPPVAPGQDEGAPTRSFQEPAGLDVGVFDLPASSPVADRRQVDAERVSVRVRLEAGLPVQLVESPSHPISIDRREENVLHIALARGRVLDDRDFVLRYRLAGDETAAGATTSAVDGEGFVSLLIEPPVDADEEEITPREVVFVLDCSGSMMGVPLEASKRFMRGVLPQLRPGDSFRIIRFSDAATEWSREPLPATPANVQDGLRYIDALGGGGGTVMTAGIRAALAPPTAFGALRLVVFLTDGYIGNDVEVVRLIQHARGDARFFSFGVGTAVNRYLIQEMARVGRGVARIVLPSEDADQAADELALRLATPVFTDVEVDWGTAPVRDVFPRQIPDLFLGQSLRVMARYEGSGEHRVTVRGRVAGRVVALPLDVALRYDDEGLEGAALPVLWARAQIEDRMISYIDPSRDSAEKDALREEVVQLGLDHRLVTQWTSFVAVAKEVVNPDGRGIHTDVVVPKVEGLSDSAYPANALPGGQRSSGAPGKPGPRELVVPANPSMLVASNDFHGSAAPEPDLWVAALAIFVVATLLHRRQWQNLGGSQESRSHE